MSMKERGELGPRLLGQNQAKGAARAGGKALRKGHYLFGVEHLGRKAGKIVDTMAEPSIRGEYALAREEGGFGRRKGLRSCQLCQEVDPFQYKKDKKLWNVIP